MAKHTDRTWDTKANVIYNATHCIEKLEDFKCPKGSPFLENHSPEHFPSKGKVFRVLWFDTFFFEDWIKSEYFSDIELPFSKLYSDWTKKNLDIWQIFH